MGIRKGLILAGGLQHPFAPGYAGDQQAAATGLRQTDDLLPTQHPHAGGYVRHPHPLKPRCLSDA